MAQFNRGVFLTWILANILGLAVLAGLMFLLPALRTFDGLLPVVLQVGIPLGLAQWLALRRFSKISPIWIFTIPAGMLLYFLVYEAVPDTVWRQVNDESLAALTAATLFMGLLVGLAQWPLLRSLVSKSWIWPLASSAGLGLSFLLVAASNLINDPGLLPTLAASLTYTTLTGLALAYLIASRGHTAPTPAPV